MSSVPPPIPLNKNNPEKTVLTQEVSGCVGCVGCSSIILSILMILGIFGLLRLSPEDIFKETYKIEIQEIYQEIDILKEKSFYEEIE